MIQWLGQTSYENATGGVMVNAVANVLIGFECPLTVTLGKRAGALTDEIKYSDQINVVHVERGGHATLHNLGQLVVYPKVDIQAAGVGVREFVKILEDSLIETAENFGVKLHREGCEPGLYSDQGKVAFIGLRIRKGVVYHGLSLNVCNDLGDFAKIRSCGKWDVPVSSLHQEGAKATPEEAFNVFCAAFKKRFSLLV